MKRMIRVREFMSSPRVVAHGDMLLPKLVNLMRTHQVRSAPVVDDRGHLIGVVTESDLFLRPKGVPFSIERLPSLFGQIVDPEEFDRLELCKRVRVEEVMTRNVTTVGEDAALVDVAMLMYERKLTLVPVVAAGRLIGVVRRLDVLEMIYGDGQPAAEVFSDDLVPEPVRGLP
jgi:CBS domain-containing protein